MGKRKLPVSEDEEEDDSDEDFLVEVITKARDTEDGNKEYFVKWHGYPSDDDSWEPYEHVEGCDRLLDSFWKEVGRSKRDRPGPPGRVYTPSDDWIQKERNFFKKTVASRSDEKKKSKRKGKEKERAGSKEKLKKKEVMPPKKQNSTEPPPKKKLAMSPASSSTTTLPNDGDLLRLFDEDDDDKPLATKIAKKEKKPPPGLGSTPTAQPTIPVATTSKTPIPKKVDALPRIPGPTPKPIPTRTASMSAVQPSVPQKSKFAGLKIPKRTPSLFINTSITHPDAVASKSAAGEKRATAPLAQRTSLGASQVKPSSTPVNTTPVSSVSANAAPPSAPPAVPKPTLVSEADVDNILATIAPKAAAMAQRPDQQADVHMSGVLSPLSPYANTIPLPKTALSSGLKFERKWKWSGELFSTEKLCDIDVIDVVELSPNGFRFDVIFHDKDSLRIEKTYKKAMALSVLPAMSRVDQFAFINPTGERDKTPFDNVVKYLEREGLVSFIPYETVYGPVAEIIVYPASMKDICHQLHLPTTEGRPGSLIIAILSWGCTPSRYKELTLRTRATSTHPLQPDTSKLRIPSRNSLFTRRVALIMKFLGIPEELVRSMAGQDYCVWADSVEKMPKDSGKTFIRPLRHDTLCLLRLLEEIGAVNVGYKHDLRAVFVHVGAVSTLRKLPAFMERLVKRPDLRFFTYGWHERIHPRQWGIREIFPIGGIVTITHKALYEDPIGVGNLLERLSKHPLWDCFILSSVLSVYIRSVGGKDPLAAFRDNPFVFGNILQLISEGKLALLYSFPGTRHIGYERGHTLMESWMEQQLVLLTKSDRDLIHECWTRFLTDFIGKSAEEKQTILETDIMSSLAALQLEPVIQDSYRRFVVIKGSQETHIQSDKDGFEWRSLQEFDFKDDYYPKLEKATNALSRMAINSPALVL